MESKELTIKVPVQDEVLEIAEAFEIANYNDLRLAVSTIQNLVTFQDQIDEAFNEHIEAAHKQHKALLAKKKKYVDPVAKAESIYREKIGDYCHETGDSCDALSVRIDEVAEFDGDIMEVVKLVAKGKLPVKLLKVDAKALKDAVKAGFVDNIPGLNIKEKPVVTIRRDKNG